MVTDGLGTSAGLDLGFSYLVVDCGCDGGGGDGDGGDGDGGDGDGDEVGIDV